MKYFMAINLAQNRHSINILSEKYVNEIYTGSRSKKCKIKQQKKICLFYLETKKCSQLISNARRSEKNSHFILYC